MDEMKEIYEELKKIPKANFDFYIGPHIPEHLLQNALTVISGSEKYSENYYDIPLALCVIDKELEGFHCIIFTKYCLIVKTTETPQFIPYKGATFTFGVNTDSGEKILYIQNKANTNYVIFESKETADFFTSFADFMTKKIENELSLLVNDSAFTETILSAKENNQSNYLYNYRDIYGNDILMLSIINGNDKLTEGLLKILPEFYSTKNFQGESFLYLAALKDKQEIYDKYFAYNGYVLVDADCKKQIHDAQKSYSFDSKLNKGITVVGGFLNGLANMISGSHEQYNYNSYYEKNEELQDNLDTKIEYIKQQYYKKCKRISLEELHEAGITETKDIEEKIVQAQNKIEQQIQVLKKEKLAELLEPKGEFETTAEYNKRLEKSKTADKHFEKDFKEEIEQLKKEMEPIVQEELNNLSEEMAKTKYVCGYFDLLKNAENSKKKTQALPKNTEKLSLQYIPCIKPENVVLESYDADNEVFGIKIFEDSNFFVKVPIKIAPDFKQYFSPASVSFKIEIKNGQLYQHGKITFQNNDYEINS